MLIVGTDYVERLALDEPVRLKMVFNHVGAIIFPETQSIETRRRLASRTKTITPAMPWLR